MAEKDKKKTLSISTGFKKKYSFVMPLDIKENFKNKKLNKISAYFKRIGEKETMNGTYIFEDGTSEEGCSYNNNYLSGTINFSNDEDHISISEFIEGLKDVNWASQVASSIDNFEGEVRWELRNSIGSLVFAGEFISGEGYLLNVNMTNLSNGIYSLSVCQGAENIIRWVVKD